MEGALRYASDETPMPGDRIQGKTGELGTVTAIVPLSRTNSELARITIRWDEGIVEIDYSQAGGFTLVSRGLGTSGIKHGREAHS